MKITEEEILAKKTPAGGWTKDTLAQWGVPWPPPKGWKRKLIDGEPVTTEDDEIHKMICLSTCHVCGDTARDLKRDGATLPVRFDKSDYGWFIHVSTDDTPEERAEYPEDIQAILAYARARGCGWIMLDSDGPVVDGLKTWEW